MHVVAFGGMNCILYAQSVHGLVQVAWQEWRCGGSPSEWQGISLLGGRMCTGMLGRQHVFGPFLHCGEDGAGLGRYRTGVRVLLGRRRLDELKGVEPMGWPVRRRVLRGRRCRFPGPWCCHGSCDACGSTAPVSSCAVCTPRPQMAWTAALET